MLPELRFFSWSLSSYFLIQSLIFVGAILYWNWRLHKEKMNVDFGLNLGLALLLSGFIGARVFHIYFEAWDFYKEHPLRMLQFWYGGFVYYGGLIGGFLGGLGYLQWMKFRGKKQRPWGVWADYLAPALSLSYAAGRFGCFMNGCCFGQSCPFPWAVQGLHPTQLYAMLMELTWFAVVFLYLQKTTFFAKRNQPGVLFCLWILGHAAGRIVMEMFRDDPRGPELWGQSVSTWVSVGLILAAMTYLVRTILPAPARTP